MANAGGVVIGDCQRKKKMIKEAQQKINEITPEVIDKLTGRPFVIWAICQTIASVFVWFGKISEFCWLAVLGIYFGGMLTDSWIKAKGVNSDKTIS
jgi:hypothetical protein